MIDLEQLIAEAVARELDRRGLASKPANDAEAIVLPTVSIPWTRANGGFVYFLQCDAFPYPIKIGSAVDIPQRLRALRAGNPFDVRLVGWSFHVEPQHQEKQLHMRFARLRLRSEWFFPSAEIVEAVAEANRLSEASR